MYGRIVLVFRIIGIKYKKKLLSSVNIYKNIKKPDFGT